MKNLIALTIVLLSMGAYSQSCSNWYTEDFDSFEYTTNSPHLIPGTVYHLSPQGSGFGPSHSGNLHLYLNFVNGYTGPAYDRPYTVCIGNTYRISFYHRDAWGGTNNTTFNVYDGNGNLLNSDNVVWTGAAWNHYVTPEFTATTTTLRLEVVNNTTVGNNDMVIDDMSLEVCGVVEAKNHLVCDASSGPVNLFDLFSSGMTAGGTWSGPSALANGDLGTFDPLVNAPGVYSYDQTTLGCPPPASTVNVTIANEIDLGPDTTVCPGTILTLDAGPGFDTYTWSNTSTTQTTNVVLAGTYTVEAGVLGGNVIINGDFEAGDTDFTTDYGAGSGGAWGLLSSPGEYAITTSPSLVHNNFSFCGDHTSGTGNMYVANGSGSPNTNVWCQNVDVTPNTDYYFSAWVANALNDPNVANMQFYVNGAPIGSVFGTSPTGCVWQQFGDVWNSGAMTNVDICIVNQNTTASGNDFALDDISFAPLCIKTDDIVVTVQNLIQNEITIDPTCATGSDGEIHVDTPNATEYNIDGGPFQADSFFVNLGQGTYSICSRSAIGCVICQNVTLTDPTPMLMSVSPDTTICENGTATISASATGGTTFTYHWDFTTDTNPSQIVNPAVSSSYTVYAENEDGCTSPTETIEVFVNPPIDGTISADVSICPGDDVDLNATATGGIGGPYTFSWSPGPVNTGNASDQINVSPSDTTLYTLTITDGCESTPFELTTTVNVAPLPVPQYILTNPDQCEPATFDLINNTDPALSEFVTWVVNGEQTFVNQDAISTGEWMAGSYDVQMIVTSFEGCVDSTTFLNALVVNPVPTASFTYSPNPVTMFSTQVQFTNSSTGADIYDWSFVDGEPSTSTAENPSVLFPDGVTGEYDVTLTVTSEHGCIDSTQQTVIVYPEVLIYAPNTFTPDGDEFNQDWRVYMEGIDVFDWNIQIFNRWGQLVWESDDINIGWDATYQGKLVEDGTYVWIIRTKDLLNDNKYTFNGHVNVIK